MSDWMFWREQAQAMGWRVNKYGVVDTFPKRIRKRGEKKPQKRLTAAEKKDYQREYQKRWRKRNPDYNREWRAENPLAVINYKRRWRSDPKNVKREAALTLARKNRGEIDGPR